MINAGYFGALYEGEVSLVAANSTFFGPVHMREVVLGGYRVTLTTGGRESQRSHVILQPRGLDFVVRLLTIWRLFRAASDIKSDSKQILALSPTYDSPSISFHLGLCKPAKLVPTTM